MPTVYERIAALINSLDNYSEVRFTRSPNRTHGDRELDGIVRDMPRPSGEARRVTMIGFGSEWFLDAEALERNEIVGIAVRQRGHEDFMPLVDAS